MTEDTKRQLALVIIFYLWASVAYYTTWRDRHRGIDWVTAGRAIVWPAGMTLALFASLLWLLGDLVWSGVKVIAVTTTAWREPES